MGDNTQSHCSYSNLNKVRIVALYIQHRQGVPDEDRRRLYQHARLSMAEQDAVNALIHLGVRITRVRLNRFLKHRNLTILQGPSDRDVKKTVKSKNNTDDEYELSRFRPILTTVLEASRIVSGQRHTLRVDMQDQAVDRLDPSTFPYLKDKPGAVGATYTPGKRTMPVAAQPTSLRSTKPTWHKGARGAQSASDNRQRILVFVAGGMTYSEIREAYQLSTKLNKEILIGELCNIYSRCSCTTVLSRFNPYFHSCSIYERYEVTRKRRFRVNASS